MALKNKFMIGVMLVGSLVTSSAWGQKNTPGTYFERTPPTAQNLPLATPNMFDYDAAQVFAPLEFTNGKEKAPNTGFYFDIARSYTSIPRATRTSFITGGRESLGSEYFWGTIYELGWFSENDAGWSVNYHDINGQFQADGRDSAAVAQTIVSTNVSTVEINRVFRQALSNGAYFEPYLGLRYNGLSDRSTLDSVDFLLIDTDGDGTPDQIQDDNRSIRKVTNSAVGLQAGGRYNVRRGRWRFSCDGLIATTYNQQRLNVIENTIRTDPNNPTIVITSDQNFSDQAFVPVIDGTFEMAYNVSRDISLKLGVQAMYMWNGIARVNTGAFSATPAFDENLTAAGFIFGAEWRR